MSVPEANIDYPEVDELLWEQYLLDCRANELKPSIKDYMVWIDEQIYDIPVVEAE